METHCFNNGNWEFPLLKLIWMFLGVILLVVLLFFRVILPIISLIPEDIQVHSPNQEILHFQSEAIFP